MIPLYDEEEIPYLVEKLNLDLEYLIEKGELVPHELDDYSLMVYAWADIDEVTGSYEFVGVALYEPSPSHNHHYAALSFSFDADTKKFKFGADNKDFTRFMNYAQNKIQSDYRTKMLEDNELDTMPNNKLAKLLLESAPDTQYVSLLNEFVERLTFEQSSNLKP